LPPEFSGGFLFDTFIALKQFTLSRQERLKSRKQIDLLFRQGNPVTVFPLRVSYILEKGRQEEPLQFGVGVSGKWFKKAVDRNRIKRLARESWRLQKNSLKQILIDKGLHMIVFVVYTGRELPESEVIRQSTASVIEKLERAANETDQANT
jgi:ribonuclease P protein component